MAEAQVYARLNAIAQLGGRVYPLVLPQTVDYPAATYRRLTATRHSKFRRDSTRAETTIEVYIYERLSAGYAALNTLANLVRAAFQRVASPSTTPPIYDVFILDEDDDYETATELLVKRFDFRIWYGES